MGGRRNDMSEEERTMKYPRVTMVQVILNSVDASNKAHFDILPAGNDALEAPVDAEKTLKFYNNEHDGIVIEFVLIDKTGENYSFPSQAADAVSSDWGPASTSPPSGTNNVFAPIGVSGYNNNVLSVRNENLHENETFGYVLWFTNPEGKSGKIDPGGINMNGSGSRK
jgi:hypothetical protein